MPLSGLSGCLGVEMIEYTLKEAERVWLISDTHFDHTNIIRYCKRPFVGIEEMNEYIVQQWRCTVALNDIVYFLGDMAFGRGSRNPRWWATRLSGKITWIKGSHDKGIRPTSIIDGVEGVVLSETIVCNGIEFMLVHDTLNAGVNGWQGWVIHGHNHDNQPHFSWVRRRVNVSVEVIDYKPISLANIVREVESDNL